MRVCTSCHQILSEGDAVCPRDGAQGQETQLARVPGQLHARFPAIEPFARGSTGSVFLAVQAQSGYRGLLKLLAPEMAASPAERGRLKRELRKQTALTNNSLARIIDGGEIGTDLWLFRDYVQGESLAVRLRQKGPLPVPEALAIVAQVASALDEVHRQGLLHRDIKPGHVILTPRVDAVPMVTVIDTGIAARLPTESVFELLGTPAYIAPEVLQGKPTSFRSDLYALGCLLHEMLMGAPPFVADTVEAVLTAHRDLEAQEVTADLPTPVQTLLQSLLAKEPRRRPFSAQQVRRALDPYLPAGTPEPASGSRTLAGNMVAPRASSPELGGVTAATTTGKMAAVSPPSVPRASTPKARVDDKLDPDNVTQEINLEEIESAALARNAPSQATQEIDLESVLVATRSSPNLMTEEIDIEPPASPDMTPPPSEQTSLPGASEHVASAAGEPQPSAAESDAPAEPGTEDASAAARQAVDFDVESLFDDELDPATKPIITPPAPAPAPPRPSVPPSGRSVPPPVFGSAPGQPFPRSGAAVEDLELEPEPDPEGTVVMQRKAFAPKRRPWPLLVGAATLLVIALAFGLRGRHDAAEPAADGGGSNTAATPPQGQAGSASDHPQGTAVAAQPSGAAPTAGNEPAPPPSAAAAQPEPVAPARSVPPPSPAAASSSSKSPGRSTRSSSPVPYHPPPAAEPGVDYKAKGRELFQAGKYREAAAAYERATEQTPSDAGAFAGLGASRLSAKQPDKAILAYQRAVQLRPQTSGFHAALARAYMQKNDRGRAAAAYKKAIELDPSNQAAKTALAALGQ